MRHSKEEILAILDQLESKKTEDLESETLDFKQWIDRPKELYKMLVEYAVCFANHKGGREDCNWREREYDLKIG